jgi:RNA polymerase sigma-70 factor, ECF subfamily
LENLVSETFHIDENEINIDYIMNKYGQDILQLVYSYVNNKEVAEDLTQDIFVKCYKALHTYSGKSKLKTWLWRIKMDSFYLS